jgi:hypothetical protein
LSASIIPDVIYQKDTLGNLQDMKLFYFTKKYHVFAPMGSVKRKIKK